MRLHFLNLKERVPILSAKLGSLKNALFFKSFETCLGQIIQFVYVFIGQFPNFSILEKLIDLSMFVDGGNKVEHALEEVLEPANTVFLNGAGSSACLDQVSQPLLGHVFEYKG